MIGKTLIKALIRLDTLIEGFQNSLQDIRVKIIETAWDLKEKQSKRQVRPRVQFPTKPSSGF